MGQPDQNNKATTESLDRASLSYPEFITLMQERQQNFHQLPERANLIEIAKILSNSNPQVVENYTLLVNDNQAFYQKHQEWCDENCEPGDILSVTTYWLTGYDTDFKYGGYIDWREEREEVLDHLQQTVESLGYPISLDDIDFPEEAQTYEDLDTINKHLQQQSYTLVSLNTWGDSYSFFVVPTDQYAQLKKLGETIGLDFYDKYL